MCEACDPTGLDVALNQLQAETGAAKERIGKARGQIDVDRRSILAAAGAGLLAAITPGAHSGEARAAETGKIRIGLIAEPAHGLCYAGRRRTTAADLGQGSATSAG